MKKIFLLITVFLIAGMTAWSQVKVTFNVDMSVWAKNGYFKPATDTVRVSGDFDGNGWSTTATTLTPGTGADSLKYHVQVDGVAAGVAHYKFILLIVLVYSGKILSPILQAQIVNQQLEQVIPPCL